MFPVSTGNGSAPAAQIAQFRSDGFNANTGLRVPFFSDAFARGVGLPDTRLVNMICESTPLREERPFVPLVGMREILYPRPGLLSVMQVGTGPIRGLYAIPPGIGGSWLIVSGTQAWTDTGTLLGTVPGTGLVRGAASPHQLVIATGGLAFLYDQGGFRQIVNGVLPLVNDVAYLAGRFVYPAVGSNRFWYSEVDDAANESGLDFASAETSPDAIVAVATLDDELVFFKKTRTEFWNVSTDPAAPFQPIEGRGYQRGAISRAAIVNIDNALFFIGDDGIVYRSANTPSRISSNTIEDRIRACGQAGAMYAFAVIVSGHPFYVLNLPGTGTYAYDVSRVGTEMGAYGDSYQRGQWGEWQSWQHPQFRGACAIMTGANAPWIGDDTTSDIWTMAVGTFTDAAGPMSRQASAFIKIEEGNPRCAALALECVEGTGNAVAPGNAPLVELRFSDDLGHTFGPWRPASLGAQGRYGPPRAYWNRLGRMRAPGRLVEVRSADPVNFTLSHIELNPLRSAW